MSDKPYRVYRGGRRVRPRDDEPELNVPGARSDGDGAALTAPPAPVAGRRPSPVILPPAGAVPPPGVPAPRTAEPRRGGDRPRAPLPSTGDRRRRAPRLGRVVSTLLLLTVLALGVWVVVGYLAFRRSVEAANARLERLDPKAVPALTGQGGLPLRTPTNVLVLGADRTGRADSMQILHADGGENLVSTLAIPRDLRLAIPGHGERKLNEAYALGGPALAIQTVQQLTGLPIHHVVVVDFNGFRDLIDAVGGIEVTSSQAIRSTFDGITFNFVKGRNVLDGRRALAYARVRKNELNTADSDVSRGVRQAQVIAALKDELISPSTILRLRRVGEQLASPLATDLSANEILALGWVDFRAQRSLACNLGGTPTSIGGGLYLSGDSEGNRRVIGEFLGRTAVRRGTFGPYDPVCRVQAG